MATDILVVEDDVEMATILREGLEQESHSVTIARDGEEGLDKATQNRYHAMVLDVMLPLLDGFEVASALRRAGNSTPILMLTARDSISDKVRGFDCGIEDFVTKPFSFLELAARIRSLVRRSFSLPRLWQAGDLLMDTGSHHVSRAGRPIGLTKTEDLILEALLRNCSQVVSRKELIRTGWESSAVVDDNNLDVIMSALRAKVDRGHALRLIQTVRGFGYRIEAPASGAATKSGTNDLHGSLFEYLRNSAFDSRSPFDQALPSFRMNQFGAAAGGPIVKDRTFFFLS